MPPPDLGDTIDAIEGEPVATIGEDGIALRRPQFAIAAARTGDGIGLEAFIEKLPWFTDSEKDFLHELASFVDIRPTEYAQL